MAEISEGDEVFVRRETLEDFRPNTERALTYVDQVAILQKASSQHGIRNWVAVYDDGFRVLLDDGEFEIAVQCPNCEGNGGAIHYGQWFECQVCNATGCVREGWTSTNG